MKGYKGFDKNFRCRDKQYEVGQKYTFDGDIAICICGFHFCDTPLAVFEYYLPADSRFALVEATGKLVSEGHKYCTDELTILKELTLDELIAAQQSAVESNTGYCSAATNTGDCSAATNTGDCSAATNTGNRSAATNTGNYSAASVSGRDSVAIVTGFNSKAKGALGCWLVLAEWRDTSLADLQAFKVDGVRLKPDTFYTLKDGVPVELED